MIYLPKKIRKSLRKKNRIPTIILRIRTEDKQQDNRSLDERQHDELPPHMAQGEEPYLDPKDYENEYQYEGGRDYLMGGELDENIHRIGSDSSNAYES